jgi:4'-phosphopantetheinyl transferase
VEISLSHTRDVLLVGISSVGLIGVDTEPADRKLYGRDVERLMCTPHERAELDALELTDRNDRLLRLWTLKEAYSKALGQGLLFPFTEFGFVPSGGSAQLARADGTLVGDAQWRYWTVRVADRFLAAIAVQNNRRSDRRDTRVGTALPTRLVSSIQDSLRARAG